MITQALEAAPMPVATPALIRVECVDTQWGFTALRPQWNELLRASAANGPFLTWEWLHTWWQCLGGSNHLRIVAVRTGDDLIALAPLMVTPNHIGWFSRLDFLGTGFAGSDYLDLVVRHGREAESITAIAGYLSAQRLAIRLDHVPPASAASLVAATLSSEHWTTSEAPGGVCPIIRLAGHTWDSYLATLGSAHRANIRRRLKGLAQNFSMRFEAVTSDAERQHALTSLIGFHTQRWETRGGSTAFSTPALRDFHDEATRRALDRGWLRMYVLRLNDVTAAVMYGFFYNRQFYFYQHGFDERYRQHSLGLALMGLSVRAAIEEGADTFDLLWGTESYKSLWSNGAHQLQQIHLFPPDMSGRIHRHALQARKHLGHLARRVITREVVSGT